MLHTNCVHVYFFFFFDRWSSSLRLSERPLKGPKKEARSNLRDSVPSTLRTVGGDWLGQMSPSSKQNLSQC